MPPILHPRVWKAFQPRRQPSPHQARPPSGNLRPHMWLLRPVPCLPPPCLPSPHRTHTHPWTHPRTWQCCIPQTPEADPPLTQPPVSPVHNLGAPDPAAAPTPASPRHTWTDGSPTCWGHPLLSCLRIHGTSSWSLGSSHCHAGPSQLCPLPSPLAHVVSAQFQGSLPSSLLQGFPLGTQTLSGIFFHPLLPWLAPYVHVVA